VTPEQLAVERDALLEGGRTLEEVEAMQRRADDPAVLHLEAILQEHRVTAAQLPQMLALVQRGSMLHHHLFDLQRATQRALALAEGRPRETKVLADLRSGILPSETHTGASAPRPSGETP